MKKRYVYLLIMLTILIISPFILKDNTKTFKIDGINYTVSVNGEKKNTFPAKGAYTVNISCENAVAIWNYQEWVAEINDITGKVSCDISFNGNTKTTFATYIKNLLGTNTSVLSTRDPNNSDGSILAKITKNGEEDYRYRGTNPNNYIMFNNELWRIIGVFDENSHGITGTHLVKIIRKDSIGQYVWDNSGSYGTNNFPTSDIYNILTSYYNHEYATGEEFCYSEKTTQKGKCDFTRIGIQTEYQNMVESGAKWFLGGTATKTIKIGEMYLRERGTTKYNTNATEIIAPIALMYPTDYGYASSADYVATAELYMCGMELNWLSSNISEWTLTHYVSSSNNAYYITETDQIYNDMYTYNGLSIRPTLYLKSDVYYISGTGTQVDPYIINID